MAVLVDTVAVIRRSNQVDVVTIAATRVARDAIEDLRAVQEITNVLLQGVQAGVDGHCPPIALSLTIRLYSSGATNGRRTYQNRSYGNEEECVVTDNLPLVSIDPADSAVHTYSDQACHNTSNRPIEETMATSARRVGAETSKTRDGLLDCVEQ